MARRRRLAGRPKYTRLDWHTQSSMWGVTSLLVLGVPSFIWAFGPNADEKWVTCKAIRGQTQIVSVQGTAVLYLWIVKGIFDGGGTPIPRFDDPDDAALAEDSFLWWRKLDIGASRTGTGGGGVEVPWWTAPEVQTQRRLQHPECLILMGEADEGNDVEVTPYHRALLARP